MIPNDRRRFQRYALRSPLGARVGAVTAAVLDASEKGLRISHEGKLPNVGTTCRLILQSAMGPITADCEIVHTRREIAARSTERKDAFESGLRVVATDFQSEQRFRELLRSLMGTRNGS
jgi:hypothetical protein